MAEPEQFAEYYVGKSPMKAAKYAARYRDAETDLERDRAAAILVELPSKGRCCDCGRELKDPVSIERGVGPDCWGKRQAKEVSA